MAGKEEYNGLAYHDFFQPYLWTEKEKAKGGSIVSRDVFEYAFY